MYIHTASNLYTRQSKGSIIVEVTTNPVTGPIEPISNVNITISSISSDGTSTVVAELVTDSVGQTPVIELDAPPIALSEIPETVEAPYSTYKVEAISDDYVPVVITGTQVFSDTTSIQPIILTPTSPEVSDPFAMAMRADDEIEDIVIGPPVLFGDYPPKIPEAETKDINASGFVVLDKVVVPQYIVVHDGSPNSSYAPTYTVPFRDYIKNVASSEIYPTWTTAAIKSNVIAIISFTLNRVYTEWYRNQGKNYTITSSTAFDHAFFYGRNIFDSISKIVDEVFDIYIKRPGLLQPLLAQYCDGRNVTCPGRMTQWGSQELGEQGLSAEAILRYFYGNDIQILSAPTVSGNPESYPGSALREGSTGAAVRTIQEQLNRISNNYPLIPKVASDGVFGPTTTEAVKVFQRVFHLTPDGVVGRDTWYKISSIYVAVTKIAELS
ncbi:MAG: peptidoglycan-binding protein [Epulopiscium sp. Nele67-Bin004]|nr:MAG: peptidoglycan-binding protein [Epulopiscium sp. Nele67-Bin004]